MQVAANDTGKVDNKASFDDEEDEDEDETDNEGGDEGGDEELDPDAAPPIPPEYVSSHLNDTIDPSPVTIVSLVFKLLCYLQSPLCFAKGAPTC